MAANVQNNGEDVQYGENVTLRDIMNDDGDVYQFLYYEWIRLYGDKVDVYACDENFRVQYLERERWILDQIRNEFRKNREELENH